MAIRKLNNTHNREKQVFFFKLLTLNIPIIKKSANWSTKQIIRLVSLWWEYWKLKS